MAQLKHKSHYVEEYEGYHGGEGFGSKIKKLDDIEFENLNESLETHFKELIENEEVERLSLKNIKIYSEDEETGEEIEININEYLSDDEIEDIYKIVLENLTEKEMKNYLNALNESKIFYEKKLSNPEDEYKNIFIVQKLYEIEKNYNYKINELLYKKEQYEKELEKLIEDIETYGEGNETQYYSEIDGSQTKAELKYLINQLNKKIEILKEQKETKIVELKTMPQEYKTKEVIDKYKRIKEERINDLNTIEVQLTKIKKFKNQSHKNKRKNNNKQ